MNPTDNEHYVPRVHLRLFTRQFRDQQLRDPAHQHYCTINGDVRVYYRDGRRPQWRPVKRVASDSQFYDLDPAWDPVISSPKIIEDKMQDVENRFGPELRAILEAVLPAGFPKVPSRRSTERVCFAADRQKWAVIAEFMAYQLVRTKLFRQQTTKQYRQAGSPASQAESLAIRTIAPWLIEPTQPNLFAQALTGGIWIFAVDDHAEPLCTSDHPVIGYFHSEEAVLTGGVTLSPPSSVFLFPLSYQVMLLVLERTWWKDKRLPAFARYARNLDGFRVNASVADVEWWNWLRAQNCESAIFAPVDDARLARFGSRPTSAQHISLVPE